MTETASMLGQVCVCSQGRIGLVTGREVLPWGESWVGVGLDNGSLWSSREPERIRTATREDLDNAMQMVWQHEEFANQQNMVYQFAEMPDSALVLILEMARSQMAARQRSRMYSQLDRWMDV